LALFSTKAKDAQNNAQFRNAGIDLSALATRLQDEGAASFVKSWNELMAVIGSKSAALQEAGSR
jgi:transaldolase